MGASSARARPPDRPSVPIYRHYRHRESTAALPSFVRQVEERDHVIAPLHMMDGDGDEVIPPSRKKLLLPHSPIECSGERLEVSKLRLATGCQTRFTRTMEVKLLVIAESAFIDRRFSRNHLQYALEIEKTLTKQSEYQTSKGKIAMSEETFMICRKVIWHVSRQSIWIFPDIFVPLLSSHCAQHRSAPVSRRIMEWLSNTVPGCRNFAEVNFCNCSESFFATKRVSRTPNSALRARARGIDESAVS